MQLLQLLQLLQPVQPVQEARPCNAPSLSVYRLFGVRGGAGACGWGYAAASVLR